MSAVELGEFWKIKTKPKWYQLQNHFSDVTDLEVI